MLRKKSFVVKLLFKFAIVWILWMTFVFLKNNYYMLSEYQRAEQEDGLTPAAAIKHDKQSARKAVLLKSRLKRSEVWNVTEKPENFDNFDDLAVPLQQKSTGPKQQQKTRGMATMKRRHHQLHQNKSRLTQVIAPPYAKTKQPGELGQPVEIDKEKLSPEERRKYDQGWKNNSFNLYASDMISLHRSLPDLRDQACRAMKWYHPLPTTSVIIIFHNEAWSVLLRTVHSVLDRSDPALLKEIILVDDFSDFDFLAKPLDDYVAKLDKVQLLRSTKREGLIRARIKGADIATGDVLVFLDSHCEASEGWLEPLLDPIARNPNVSTVPVIEAIDGHTFHVPGTALDAIQVGGFDWSLIFNWHPVPERDLKNRTSKIDPIRSPTMAGGLFAIDRKYFQTLGAYDAGMEIWGGENLELSFKIWMCGGELLCAPCSHVGHIFRNKSPYKWPKSVDGKKNTNRLAEVWLDEYKRYYFERFDSKLAGFGNVSDRKALRKSLQCKSFKWYLTNVFPEQFVPGESLYYGEIRSKAGAYCVDSKDDKTGTNVIGYQCHGQGGNQYWMMSKTNEIRKDERCLDYAEGESGLGNKLKVVTFGCHSQGGNQYWTLDNDSLLVHKSGFCLELLEKNDALAMNRCNATNVRQQWIWKKRETIINE